MPRNEATIDHHFLLSIDTPMCDACATKAIIVYAANHESGLTKAGSAERSKAVAEITKRLVSRREIRLVDQRTENAITITVTSVGDEPVWMPTPLAEVKALKPGDPIPEGSRMGKVARAELTCRTFATSFAEASGAFRSNAGGNLARSIERWFKGQRQGPRHIAVT